MNRTLSDFQRDIANGNEPRELLGQSVGFKNELIGQTNFPLDERMVLDQPVRFAHVQHHVCGKLFFAMHYDAMRH
jgi:hypothetical protein